MKCNNVDRIKQEVLSDPFYGDAIGFVLSKFGDVRDRVIFDSGCGSGKMSVLFALLGAKVIAIDKDSASINNAINLARLEGVESSCLFLQGCSQSTTLAPDSIDIVFSRSTIQYMDRDKTLNEYLRILKPDGSMMLLENLPYNPLINLYRIRRWLFKKTQQEKEYSKSIKGYITLNNIKLWADRFSHLEHHEYHLFRVVSIYLRWRLRQNFLVKELDRLFFNIDKELLSRFPFLKNFAWFTAVYGNGIKNV
jgi:SAM-dependent methyltransferase